jgi:type IV pilus assembly protein PilE
VQPRHLPGHARGFTLVELIVVVAIMAILASIAIGAYRRYVLSTNRTDGTMMLLKVQAAEEKYFLQNNTYSNQLGSDGISLTSSVGITTLATQGGFYNITVAPGSTGNLADSYLATATAISSQTDDTPCPTFTIDDQGIKGPAATVATCWK